MRLISGRKFTHREFQNETASYRLASFIEQLRNRHGWVIDSIEEIAPTKDPTGRTAKYVRYGLNPDLLRVVSTQMGGRLNSFVEAVKRFEAMEEK
jgi:hypothetical protein